MAAAITPAAFADNVVKFILPNAAGSGVDAITRSAPDGNTLAVVSNNVVIFSSVLRSLPFDMPGDFTPIAIVGATPMVLVVNPRNMPVKDATRQPDRHQHPAEAQATFKRELARFAALVKKVGLEPQ